MPLVVIVGRPCTGKTIFAHALKEYLRRLGKIVVLLNDEALGIGKRTGYENAAAEKISRGALKSAVERHVNTHTCVILDACNYIKGFRYELYCIVRAAGSTHACVWVDAPRESAREWNAARPEAERYPNELLDELWSRFEAPDARNRWDRPLFRAHHWHVSALLGHMSVVAALEKATEEEALATAAAAEPGLDHSDDTGSVEAPTDEATATEEASRASLRAVSTAAAAEEAKPAVPKSSFHRAGAFRPAKAAAATAPTASAIEAPPTVSSVVRDLPASAPEPSIASRLPLSAVRAKLEGAAAGTDSSEHLPSDAARIPLAVMPDGSPIVLPVFEHVTAALYARAGYSAPLSVVQTKTASVNYLHSLDTKTTEIVTMVAATMPSCFVGDRIPVPGSPIPLILMRKTTLSELKRLKKNFDTRTAPEAVPIDSVPRMFVEYINLVLSSS